jgi:putative heme transporter
MAEESSHRSRWRGIITAATFIALAILIYSLRRQIVDVVKNLQHVHASALLLMIPLQIINYDVYARMYRHFFKILGDKVSYWAMYKLALELNFVNHILPSGGISGVSYFSVRMRSEGVSGPKATLAQIMKFFLLFLSFQPILIVGLFMLALHGRVNNLIILVASSLITLLVVGTWLGIYVIGSRSRINTTLTFVTKSLNNFIGFFRRSRPETINVERAQTAFGELHDNYLQIKNNWSDLKMPFIYMIIANLTEVAAVYVVYIAFGELVNFGAVILAYAIANFAGLISVLPAGIGIYEGLMTGVLAATGIAASVSIPVTIMYRVLNMFVQLTPGYVFYQRAVKAGLGKAK